jgi:hypothetical protein
MYAYLQTGQDKAARELLQSLPEVRARFAAAPAGSYGSVGAFALAAIPARYALERGAWADAARLTPAPNAPAYADAITWFARGLGAARAGQADVVKEALAELQRRVDSLNQAGEKYWAEQVAIQRLGVEAWLALAEGRGDAALATMREAADREDRTEKSAISPGPLAPARELLAEMLLQLRRPQDALVEFRKTIAKEPNRFRGLAGAAAAAEQAGDAAAARQFRRQLADVCAKGDTPGRAELQAARQAR